MSIVCEEIFDEDSHPSVDEIRDYAKKIGIDPDTEPELLPLAAEGLMEGLPAGWKPCYDDNRKCYYYYNNLTGKTQWEHPLDDVYRGLVKKVRTESQSLSLAAGEQTEDATFNQELPSFDEPYPKKLEQPLSTRKLAPLNPHKLLRQRSDEQLLKSHKTALFSSSFDEKIDADKYKKNQELTVSGGGAMFLKTNTQKKNDQMITSPNRNEPKGILRERNCLEVSKSMDFDKLSSEKSEKDEDDKKSVRFNLDTNTDIGFTFSDKSLSDDDDDDDIISDKNNIINVKIDNKLNKTRFTVSPVKEIDNNSNNLKLIKPNPNDFLQVSDDSNDDNSDEILQKSKKLEEKADKRMEKLKKNLWEEKNDELIKFRNDLQQSQDGEFERILIKTKQDYEDKIKSELENLRIEMENRKFCTLKEERLKFDAQLDELKRKLQQQFDDDVKKMQEDYENKKEELEKYYEEKLVEIERDLAEKVEKQRDELILINNSDIEQLKQNHTIIIEQLKRDFKIEEDCLKRDHKNSIQELRNQLAHEQQLLQDNDDYNKNRNYEKIRCEKRLLEDKYRCLKEKYLRLKTDVKLSIEKRNKRKEQSVATTTTTGSETEKSHSTNKDKTPLNSPLRKPPTPKHNRPEHRTTRQLIIQDLDTSFSDDKSDDKDNKINDCDSSDNNSTNPGRSRKRIFSRLKSSSTSRINNNNNNTNNNNNNNIGMKGRRNYTQQQQQRSCSPVENLRRQLQKLEDLEDQFPQPTTQTNNDCNDTYHLRYPFSDGQKFDKGSSELEFFRHRIHLERDSIKRAKESLRNQKSLFQQRQKELKLKHGSMARHTFQQLCQEEKELTDMEVSLHRTRSLLGEKVIRLRHLEQSLQRATMTTTATAENRQDDTTLSDLSSHSASSGISSTEFATADGIFNKNHLQESSEIIQSLENLNCEIREIWDVLRKQQQQHTGTITAVPIPSPFLYPDLGWSLLAGSTTTTAQTTNGATVSVPAAVAPPSIPTLADRLNNYRQQVALANAQSTMVTHATNQQGATTTLIERTRNLRHWLRQASIDNNLEGGNNTPQATL